MKRLICAGLTLALLMGMCAAATAGYQTGDVDGVIAKQLQAALEKGNPAPNLNPKPAVSPASGDLPKLGQLITKYGAKIAVTIMSWRNLYYDAFTPLEGRGIIGAKIIEWALANGVDVDDIIKAGSFAVIALPPVELVCCAKGHCDGCSCIEYDGESPYDTCDHENLCPTCSGLQPTEPTGDLP